MKTNLNFITIIILFSLLLPVSLFAQLSDNEREDLSAYINNNSSMLNYALNLRTKLLNDVEFSKNLKSCCNNIKLINFVKDTKSFFNGGLNNYEPLKTYTDKILNKMGHNFLIEIFPEYDKLVDDLLIIANLTQTNVNTSSNEKLHSSVNYDVIRENYVIYRNYLSKKETFDKIQVEFAKEYEDVVLKLRKEINLTYTEDYDYYILFNLEHSYQKSFLKKIIEGLNNKKTSSENEMQSCDRMILAKLEEYRNKEKEENLTTKIVSGPGIVGTWKWFTGDDLVFTQNGQVMKSGIQIANWTLVDAVNKKYEVYWPNLQYKPLDKLTLSNNDSYLEGYNQYNTTVTANKIK
jgi:hypothetical protein